MMITFILVFFYITNIITTNVDVSTTLDLINANRKWVDTLNSLYGINQAFLSDT